MNKSLLLVKITYILVSTSHAKWWPFKYCWRSVLSSKGYKEIPPPPRGWSVCVCVCVCVCVLFYFFSRCFTWTTFPAFICRLWSQHSHILSQIQCCHMCGFVSTCVDFNICAKLCWFSIKKLQFSIISAQIFISMPNTWTDLNFYILHVLISYCRRSDYVTSGVLACLVSRSRT